MILKGRLGLIADKVPPCKIICDIGTDHAHIPLFLIKSGRCTRAVAADVKKGPLLAAEKNIRDHGLEKLIETRLGDGLEPIQEDEADVIVIAGMGGILIKDILNREFNKAKKAERLILQPMNAVEILRAWLYDNGFEVIDEELENEGSKIYNVIVARWTGKAAQTEEFYTYIGIKLIEKKDPLLKRLLDKKIKQLNSSIAEMDKSEKQDLDNKEKYIRLRNCMQELLEKLNVSGRPVIDK